MSAMGSFCLVVMSRCHLGLPLVTGSSCSDTAVSGRWIQKRTLETRVVVAGEMFNSSHTFMFYLSKPCVHIQSCKFTYLRNSFKFLGLLSENVMITLMVSGWVETSFPTLPKRFL